MSAIGAIILFLIPSNSSKTRYTIRQLKRQRNRWYHLSVVSRQSGSQALRLGLHTLCIHVRNALRTGCYVNECIAVENVCI